MAAQRLSGLLRGFVLVGVLLTSARVHAYDPRELEQLRRLQQGGLGGQIPPGAMAAYQAQLDREAADKQRMIQQAGRFQNLAQLRFNEAKALAAKMQLGPDEMGKRASVAGACGPSTGNIMTASPSEIVALTRNRVCAKLLSNPIPRLLAPPYEHPAELSMEPTSVRTPPPSAPETTPPGLPGAAPVAAPSPGYDVEAFKRFRTDGETYLTRMYDRLDFPHGWVEAYLGDTLPGKDTRNPSPIKAEYEDATNFAYDQTTPVEKGINKATIRFFMAFSHSKGRNYTATRAFSRTKIDGTPNSEPFRVPVSPVPGLDHTEKVRTDFDTAPFGAAMRVLYNAHQRVELTRDPPLFEFSYASNRPDRRTPVRYAVLDLIVSALAVPPAPAFLIGNHAAEDPAQFQIAENGELPSRMFYRKAADSLTDAIKSAESFLAKDLEQFKKNADDYEKKMAEAKEAQDKADKLMDQANRPSQAKAPTPSPDKKSDDNKGGDGKKDGGGGGGGGGGPQAQGGGSPTTLGQGPGGIETGNAVAPSAFELGGVVGAPNPDGSRRSGFIDPISGLRNPFNIARTQGQPLNQALNFAGGKKPLRAPAAAGGAAGSPIAGSNNGQAPAAPAGTTGGGGTGVVAGQPGGGGGGDSAVLNGIGASEPEYRAKNDFRRTEEYMSGGGGGGGESADPVAAVAKAAGGGGGGSGEALSFAMQIKQPRQTAGQRQRRLGIMGYIGTFGETCWSRGDSATRTIPMGICEGRPRVFPGGADTSKDAPAKDQSAALTTPAKRGLSSL